MKTTLSVLCRLLLLLALWLLCTSQTWAQWQPQPNHSVLPGYGPEAEQPYFDPPGYGSNLTAESGGTRLPGLPEQLPDPDSVFHQAADERMLVPPGGRMGGSLAPELSSAPADTQGWRRMFVRSQAVATWLAPGGENGMGLTYVWASTSIALPGSSETNAFIVSPGFGVEMFDGPANFFLPGQLYETWIDFAWRVQYNECWKFDFGVTPGLYTDFQQQSSENLRIQGRALATYQWSPQLQLLGGVVYLDRPTVGVLPAAGLIWTPTESLRVEAVMPRPRVAWRFVQTADNSAGWAFLAGEFGGGAWGVEQPAGNVQRLEYNDYRVIFGLEWKGPRRLAATAEVGYVFGRELEYENGPSLDLDDTVMLRACLIF